MKSPIKRRPLRNPGDSLDEEIQEVAWQQGMAYYFFAAFLVVLAGLEWWQWYTDAKPNPIPFSVIALCAVALAVYKMRKAASRIRTLKLGRSSR